MRALRRGQVRREVFDVEHLHPATLKGTVSLDGAPARFAGLLLMGRGNPGIKLDGNGRFHIRSLLAGEFTPALVIDEFPRTIYDVGEAPIRFRAGEAREIPLCQHD